MIKKTLISLILGSSVAFSAAAIDNIDELIIDDDPYIGVTIDFSAFSPMVALSNLTDKLTPSKYVQNVDRLIVTLADSKTATKELFKNNNKKLEYIPQSSKFKVKSILKTAIYKGNIPDEYTSYIIENKEGVIYTLPEREMKNISRAKLTSYEKGLLEQFAEQDNYARVVIYLKKPPLYKDKKAPYEQKDLNAVFDFFLNQLKDYDKDKVLMSQRNFRLSMNISGDTLAYIISEFDNLYIEDVEVISIAKKQAEEKDYASAMPRRKDENKNKEWYSK